jgi:DNA repair exonuclease SbcCD nuclease subunit
MKIQYCSDLHLEFPENLRWLAQNPIIPKGDILIIAGDTFYLGQEFSKQPLFDQLSDNFEQVFLIPGNHEYYGGYDAAKSLKGIDEKIQSNVRLLQNMVVEMNGVQLIFTTLWSKINMNVLAILKWMPDFRKIKYKGQKLNISQFNDLHENARLFLLKALKNNKQSKTIVITHHLPSELCTVDEFKESPLNEAFYVNLHQVIEDNPIDYWLYGHSHRNKPEFGIYNTKMITNQLGYVGYGEHHSFRRDAYIEL